MITIGMPPKKPVTKSLSDVSTYTSSHETNNNNNKNYRENHNKLVNNITTVLITNDNTEVINHYLMQQSGYDSLPSCASLNTIETSRKISDETIDESVENGVKMHQSMVTIPTQTLTQPTSNKPKRLMRKIGKLMLPKMFLNESNNNDNAKNKFKDPIIEDLKSNHDKSKVGRIKSLFMSSSVTSIPEPIDTQNDSGKENESENTIDELKRQWSIRSETKVYTPPMNRKFTHYFNGSSNGNSVVVTNDTIESKKNERNKEKLSISINQNLFDISSITNNGDNLTPITPLDSPIYFSDTSYSVMVNNDDSRMSQLSALSIEKPKLGFKQSSTPLIRTVKRRIASNSFQRFQRATTTLPYPARDFDDIYIDRSELKEADKAFDKLYKRLHATS